MKPILLGIFFIACCFACNTVPEQNRVSEIHLSKEFDSISKPRLPLPDREIIRLCTIEDSSLQSGLVTLSGLVEIDGKLSNLTVESGIGAREDSAALAKARLLPDFVPGKIEGRPVKALYYLPIVINGYAADTTSKR